MDRITRRGVLKQASVGAAAIGALAAVPGLATAYAASGSVMTPDHSTASVHGSLVAHVRDVSTGEVALLYGTREVVVHDRELVQRLLHAAQ